MELIRKKEIMEIRKSCAQTLSQMSHSNTSGTLDNDFHLHFRGACTSGNDLSERIQNTQAPVLLAVSSKGGVLVDQHFGHATDFYIYEYKSGMIHFKERRSVAKYCEGPGACDDQNGKMLLILEAVDDCDCVLTMRIGAAPMATLDKRGIKVHMTYNRIEDAVQEAVNLYHLAQESG